MNAVEGRPMKIKIEWLTDTHDCETCGTSWADGARVTVTRRGGKQSVLEFTPVARCHDSSDWSSDEVFKAILVSLGYDVEEVRTDV